MTPQEKLTMRQRVAVVNSMTEQQMRSALRLMATDRDDNPGFQQAIDMAIRLFPVPGAEVQPPGYTYPARSALGLAVGWSERAGQLVARANQLGPCTAGREAFTEATVLRQCAQDVISAAGGGTSERAQCQSLSTRTVSTPASLTG